jgi:hypothetical protein
VVEVEDLEAAAPLADLAADSSITIDPEAAAEAASAVIGAVIGEAETALVRGQVEAAGNTASVDVVEVVTGEADPAAEVASAATGVALAATGEVEVAMEVVIASPISFR